MNKVEKTIVSLIFVGLFWGGIKGYEAWKNRPQVCVEIDSIQFEKFLAFEKNLENIEEVILSSRVFQLPERIKELNSLEDEIRSYTWKQCLGPYAFLLANSVKSYKNALLNYESTYLLEYHIQSSKKRQTFITLKKPNIISKIKPKQKEEDLIAIKELESKLD